MEPLHALLDLLCRGADHRGIELFGAASWACARCTGLYLGAALGIVLPVGRVTRRPNVMHWLPRMVVLAALCNLVQVGGEQAGWVASAAPIRVVLGAALGVPLGALAISRLTGVGVSVSRAFAALAAILLVGGTASSSGDVINTAVALGALATVTSVALLVLRVADRRATADSNCAPAPPGGSS